MSRRRWARFAVLALVSPALPPLAAQTAAPLDSTLLAGFRWRNVGPANMGGRVSSVVGIPSPSKTFFVAAAAGGIWKTTNAGTSFRPVFDNQPCISMGELAIAPSDTLQLWAGTGEEDSRNTISPSSTRCSPRPPASIRSRLRAHMARQRSGSRGARNGTSSSRGAPRSWSSPSTAKPASPRTAGCGTPPRPRSRTERT